MVASTKKKPARRRAVRVPQQARSRQTRERALHAAVECFEQLGYDETNTAEIARRARIGVGTLYGYFRDKRAILLELLEATVSEIADFTIRKLDPEAWQQGDPREHVRRLIDALFHTRKIQPGLQRILRERYFKDPEFRAAVQAIEDRVLAALVRLLDSLRAVGRTRVADNASAAFVIYSAVEWTSSRLLLSGNEAAVDPAVDATADMVSRFLFE